MIDNTLQIQINHTKLQINHTKLFSIEVQGKGQYRQVKNPDKGKYVIQYYADCIINKFSNIRGSTV